MLIKKKRKATRLQLTVLHGIYCWPQNFVNTKQFLKASALISCWRLNHLIWRAGFPTRAAQLFNHLKGWNFLKGINFGVLLLSFIFDKSIIIFWSLCYHIFYWNSCFLYNIYIYIYTYIYIYILRSSLYFLFVFFNFISVGKIRCYLINYCILLHCDL